MKSALVISGNGFMDEEKCFYGEDCVYLMGSCLTVKKIFNTTDGEDCDGTDQNDSNKRGTWRGGKRLVILSKKLNVIRKEVDALQKAGDDSIKMKEIDVKKAIMSNKNHFSKYCKMNTSKSS